MAGYFNKLANATHFLALDDAQYRTRFYHNRAVIKNSHGSKSWITLPVEPTHRCAIADVRISQAFDISVIDNMLWDAYHKSPYFEKQWSAMRNIILSNIPMLVDINVALIKHIMSVIGLQMPSISFSSAGAPFADATQRLIYGCRISRANWIIMGEGGSLDCHDLGMFKEAGVQITTQEYIENHPRYIQFGKNFIAGISTLDALMCVGPQRTREMIVLPTAFKPPLKEW